MINFNESDNYRQFVRIEPIQPVVFPTKKIKNILIQADPQITERKMLIDDDELLIELDNKGLGFSLNDLKELLRSIAMVNCIVIDTHEPKQRYVFL